jgi:hypothetical protein
VDSSSAPVLSIPLAWALAHQKKAGAAGQERPRAVGHEAYLQQSPLDVPGERLGPLLRGAVEVPGEPLGPLLLRAVEAKDVSMASSGGDSWKENVASSVVDICTHRS